MRLLITIAILLLIISCAKKEATESCSDLIKGDSFYFALPLNEQQYKEMYRLENYLTQVADSTVQTIDFDCAVVVTPTNKSMDELKEILGQNFEENVKINTRHREAVTCMIESKGIRTLAATGRFIRFITKNQTWDLDIQNDTLPDWKLILFKEGKAPVVLPGLMLSMEEVETYFQSILQGGQ